MNKLVSILIPAYNAEKDLPKCLDSVINQTYQNLEILVIDDGSTDNTQKVTNDFAQRDNRVRVITQSNGGISKARNTGIENVKGQYFTFIDSDDYVTPDYVDYLVNLIEKKDCDTAVCAHQNINPGEKEIYNENGKEYVISAKEYFRLLGINRLPQGMGVSVHSRMYKSELFSGIKFIDGMNFEDSYTAFQVIDKAGKTAIGEKIKYFYVRHENSIVQKDFALKRLEFIDAEEFMVQSIQKKYPDIKEQIEYRLDYALLNTLGNAMVADNYREYLDIEKKLKKRIMKRFFSILFGKESPKRNRVGIICLLPGLMAYRASYKFFKYRQKRK